MLREPAALQRALLSSNDISESEPVLPAAWGGLTVPSASPAAAWLHLAAPVVLDPRPEGALQPLPAAHTYTPWPLLCLRAAQFSRTCLLNGSQTSVYISCPQRAC